MQCVLVTSAGGYIGVLLCKNLLEKGYSVLAPDRSFFGMDMLQALAAAERRLG